VKSMPSALFAPALSIPSILECELELVLIIICGSVYVCDSWVMD
jgi:hypothetical protein